LFKLKIIVFERINYLKNHLFENQLEFVYSNKYKTVFLNKKIRQPQKKSKAWLIY